MVILGGGAFQNQVDNLFCLKAWSWLIYLCSTSLDSEKKNDVDVFFFCVFVFDSGRSRVGSRRRT